MFIKIKEVTKNQVKKKQELKEKVREIWRNIKKV